MKTNKPVVEINIDVNPEIQKMEYTKFDKRLIAAAILKAIVLNAERGITPTIKFDTILDIVRVANGKKIKDKNARKNINQDITDGDDEDITYDGEPEDAVDEYGNKVVVYKYDSGWVVKKD